MSEPKMFVIQYTHETEDRPMCINKLKQNIRFQGKHSSQALLKPDADILRLSEVHAGHVSVSITHQTQTCHMDYRIIYVLM